MCSLRYGVFASSAHRVIIMHTNYPSTPHHRGGWQRVATAVQQCYAYSTLLSQGTLRLSTRRSTTAVGEKKNCRSSPQANCVIDGNNYPCAYRCSMHPMDDFSVSKLSFENSQPLPRGEANRIFRCGTGMARGWLAKVYSCAST